MRIGMKKMAGTMGWLGMLMLAVFLLPTAEAQGAAPRVLVAPLYYQFFPEDQVLDYVNMRLTYLYPETVAGDLAQGSTAERKDALRKIAMNGFDANSQLVLASAMLPNSGTITSVQTWFGHQVAMAGGQWIIRNWFSDSDAVLDFSEQGDYRLIILPW